jgi:serine/threonine protein phosphatase PrpC
VPDEQIIELLNSDVSAKQACHQLVDAANEAGGTDNITVVVSRFRDPNENHETFAAEVDLDDVIAKTDADTEAGTMATADVCETELVREGLEKTPRSTVRAPIPLARTSHKR